jgi:hypothetical protein
MQTPSVGKAWLAKYENENPNVLSPNNHLFAKYENKEEFEGGVEMFHEVAPGWNGPSTRSDDDSMGYFRNGEYVLPLDEHCFKDFVYEFKKYHYYKRMSQFKSHRNKTRHSLNNKKKKKKKKKQVAILELPTYNLNSHFACEVLWAMIDSNPIARECCFKAMRRSGAMGKDEFKRLLF